MTKDELWTAYTGKNPQFLGDARFTMSAAGLKKLFDQTWDFAHDKGFKYGHANMNQP